MSPTDPQAAPGPGDSALSWENGDAVVISRDDVSDFNEDNILPQPAHVQEAIRAWIKPTSYDAENGEFKKHLASYLPGTGEWLLESPTYREWHHSKSQGMLWIKGIPGSGKSVIASSLVNQLSKEGAPVLYFFFRQIIDANHTPDALLRDWLAQLLSYSPPLQLKLKEYVDRHKSRDRLSMADMWHDIKGAMTYLPKVYCVVDALDEMDNNKETFLQALAEFGRWHPSRIKVIITSRPVPKVERPLRHESILHIRLDEKHVDQDIASYVAHHLDTTSKPLTPEQKEVIKRAVPGRANGLFLYAKLAMDAFLEESADVEEVLKTLPLDLNVMYTGLLHEHARRSGVPHNLQLLILSFVTHASRPLRLLEIAEMIRITEEKQAKSIGGLEALKDLVRAACGPLLEILPDETVCVIHHSFTEFLNGSTRSVKSHDSPSNDSPSYPILETNSTHNRLALCSLSYLLSGCLQQVKLPDEDDYESDSEWGDRYYVMPAVNKDLRLHYPFLAYSVRNWHVHARKADQSGPLSDDLYQTISRVLSTENIEPLSVLDEAGCSGGSLHNVAHFGLSQYLSKLIHEDNVDVDMLDTNGDTAMFRASSAGHASVVKVLLDNGAKPDEPGGFDGKRPLHKAVERDDGEVVSLLLEAGVDPMTTKTKSDPGLMCGDPYRFIGHTPLMYAMSYGNESVARAFLPYLKSPEMATRALGWAVGGRNEYSSGCPGIIDELIKHPLVDINRPARGETPLYIALRAPNPEIAIALLEAGADPTILSASQGEEFCRAKSRQRSAMKSKNENRTPLHSICGGSRRYIMSTDRRDKEPELLPECVSLLLKAGVDIDAKDKYGCTALHYAARWWPSLVRALVKAGAETNVVRADGSTPLHVCQTLESFRILVEEGNADINQQRESDGKTALLVMMDNYNQPDGFAADLIRLHVDLGANLALTGHDGKGVLHYWVSKVRDLEAASQVEVLDTLLSSGIPLNNGDKEGRTVLHSLIGLGRDFDLVLKLVAAGADLNARDKRGRTPMFHYLGDGFRDMKLDLLLSQLDRLVSLGAQLGIRDYQGYNPTFVLMHSSRNPRGRIELIDELAKRGVDLITRDYQGNTLFHHIAATTTEDYDHSSLDLPLTLGVDADEQNYRGQSALHFMMAPRSHPCTKGLKFFKNIDIKDNDGIRPLHVAARSSEVLIHALLAKEASPTEPTAEGVTPLHVAARFRKPGIVGLLLEVIEAKLGKEGLTNYLNTFHCPDAPTALHLACRSGVPETVSLLLAAGADPNAKSRKVAPPLEWCVQYESEKALWQASRGSSISSNEPVSWQDKRIYCTRGIGLNDSERNPEEKDGPPAQLDKILSLLHDYGADLMLSKNEGQTNLEKALAKCEKTHDYTIECLVRQRQLIQKGNRVQSHDEAGEPKAKITALKIYVESLISNPQGLSLDLVQKIAASVFRRSATFDAFCQVQPWSKIWSTEMDDKQVEAFFKELLENHEVDVIEHMLRQKPRLLDTEKGGLIFSKLAQFGIVSLVGAATTRQEILQLQSDRANLLQQSKEKGVKLLTGRLECFHPLYSVCTSSFNNMAMVRYLVEELGVDVNDAYYSWPSYRETTNSYETISCALHECCRGDHWWLAAEALPYLLERGADLEKRDSCGRTTLLWALGFHSNYRLRVVKALVDAGANVNATDGDGRNCLSNAGNDIELTLLLLKHGATGSVEGLKSSIWSGNIAVLQALLDAGADPNYYHEPPEGMPTFKAGWSSADTSHVPPVFFAAMHHAFVGSMASERSLNAASIVKELLSHGANPFDTFIKSGESQDEDFLTEVVVLHQILREGGMSQSFLELPNLDLEHRNSEGMTLLLAACSSRSDPDIPIENVHYNVSKRAVREVVAKQDQKRNGPTIIEKLLDMGASITARDTQRRNALHLILSVHSFAGYESLRLILSRAPELLHQTDAQGLTPFHYALQRAPSGGYFGEFGLDTKAIEILLEAGADPLQPDPNGDSALHYVAKFLSSQGHIYGEVDNARDLFKRLVSLGVPINCRNNKGETPAFFALIYPSPANARDEAAPEGETRAQAVLTEMGADLLAVNDAGETLLHVTAGTDRRSKRNQYLLLPVIACRFRWLLDQGIDPMAEDVNSRTCLDVAAAKENHKILSMFKRPEK